MNYAEIIKKLEKLEGRIIRMEPHMAGSGQTHSDVVKRIIALEEKATTAAGEVPSGTDAEINNKFDEIHKKIASLEEKARKFDISQKKYVEFICEKVTELNNTIVAMYNVLPIIEGKADKFIELNNTLAAVEGKFDRNEAKLELQINTLFDLDKHNKKIHECFHDSMNDIRRDLQRLNDVYYHVFPERLAKDAAFEQQLRGLNGKDHSSGK